MRSRVDRFLEGGRAYQKQREELLSSRSLLLKATDGVFSFSPEAYEDYEHNSDAERPFIDLDLFKHRTLRGQYVKNIEIVYLTFPDIPIGRVPEPYILLLYPLDIGQAVQPVSKRFDHILYEQIVHKLKLRRKTSRAGYRFTVHGENTLVSYAHNIWNEYCLKEGNTTLSRVNFTIWLYKLTSIAADLIDYPMVLESLPGKRRKIIAEFLKDEWGMEYECYYPEHWLPVLRGSQFDLSEAQLTRERDACKLFLELKRKLVRRSPLEVFVWKVAESLYGRLCELQLLRKCRYCGEYFPYDSRKKFCSEISEGKRCSRSFHNHANYVKSRRRRQHFKKDQSH